MVKLRLENITKTYRSGEEITALRAVSLDFRQNEFVCVLGPSGCGKTTLLNIIGGLDRYDSGDLIINGISTRQFRGSDWDAYRNRSIGFVFQSYNLIGHQSVLQNVEIAMTLSGVSASERRQRAKRALTQVGLETQLKKMPNQLSGGQMQRVAIARALVNDPDIILADEPTGALDSLTSVQVMDILRDISKTRLVIMVTHNRELAEKYANRIIRLLDGEVVSDSRPVLTDESDGDADRKPQAKKYRKTAMSMLTAALLSFRNLLTKRGRTLITAFAGSVGIIGVALVLALSGGLSSYMSSMQSETLSGFPITVNTGEQMIDLTNRPGPAARSGGYAAYPDDDVLYSYDSAKNSARHSNVFTQDYLGYIADIKTALPDAVNAVSYSYGLNINLLAKGQDAVVKFDTLTDMDTHLGLMMGSNLYWQELPDNSDYLLSLYDLIGGGSRLPAAKNEVVLVTDKYNRIDSAFFEKLGISDGTEQYRLTDFIGKTLLKVIPNDAFYTQNGALFSAVPPSAFGALYDSGAGTPLTIVGILRPKQDVSNSYLSEGLAYTPALTEAALQDARNSRIAAAQITSDLNVLYGTAFKDAEAKKDMLLMLGADATPTGISIYPKDYESKDAVKAYLDAYNKDKPDAEQLIYSDLAETITSMTKKLLDTVTYVLVGFAAISLVVSTIMISIITYVSVIERTKEIGILRSVGARKKDISRVFNAETLIIGFIAGTLGVAISYLLSVPINGIIQRLTGIAGIANLSIVSAAALVAGSMALTLLAGFIPSRIAAARDPVVALRSE